MQSKVVALPRAMSPADGQRSAEVAVAHASRGNEHATLNRALKEHLQEIHLLLDRLAHRVEQMDETATRLCAVRDVGRRGEAKQRRASAGAPDVRYVGGAPTDLLYGAEAIGTFLGMIVRQARHRITVGDIPFFKMGRSVCARRTELTAWLSKRSSETGRAGA